MRIASVLLGAALALTLPGGSVRASADEAQATVRATMDQILRVLAREDLALDAKRVQLEEIAYARFDFTLMSRLVLGRNWRKLSPKQRQEFETEFRRHLSLSYGKRLGEYKGETIAVSGAREERNGDVTVMSRLSGGTNDGVSIDYRLRKGDAGWRVLDVIVENISLISNFRSQIQEIVSSKGPERLIEILRSKNEKEAAAS